MMTYKNLFIGLLLLCSCNKEEPVLAVSCSGVDLSAQTPGPVFLEVKKILATHCQQCHSGVNPQAGLDWSRDCDILTYWDRIKARAVDGDPSPMPQAGLISIPERKQIIDWINMGRPYHH